MGTKKNKNISKSDGYDNNDDDSHLHSNSHTSQLLVPWLLAYVFTEDSCVHQSIICSLAEF